MEQEIPGLLHQLSIQQSVDCMTDYGQKLRLRVNRGKRSFHIELVLDDKEWHRYPNE